MKNILTLSMFLAFLASCSPLVEIQGLKEHPQQGQYWCWAATSQMIIEKYMGSSPAQCELVTIKFNNSQDCCNENNNNSCMRASLCDTNQATSTPRSYITSNGVTSKLNSKGIDTKPTWEEFKAIIDGGSPIIYSYNTGSTHIVVITGYFDSNSNQKIKIYDPLEGGTCKGGYINKTFEDFVNGYLYYLYDFQKSTSLQ